MLKPLRCHIEYLSQDGTMGLLRSGFPALDENGCSRLRGMEFDLLLKMEGYRLDLMLEARSRVTIARVSLEFPVDLSTKQRLLLNGYQSWTDTFERSPKVRQRGLNTLPDKVVERFVLDGSGDYRFVNYSGKSGQLHGWTYAYLQGKERTQLFASLTEDQGFTMIRTNAAEGILAFEPEPPERFVEAGESLSLGSFCVTDDGHDDSLALQRAFDQWFDLMGTEPRPARPLTGYCTWYRHYGDIDEARVLADLQLTKLAYDQIDAEGLDKVFQIDDGYSKVGDWLNVKPGFPSGMKALAGWISDAGFIPGLWIAPFVAELDSKLVAEHPDWLLTDEYGVWVETGSHWSGGLALDTQNPEVRAYVRQVIRTAVEEWGFKYLKLDFLYAACMLPHNGLNRGQLMADAIQLVREAAGPDVLINGCGVPLASAFGQFEYCRIGCDMGLDWNGRPHMSLTERERVSTRNSIANAIYRSQLNGRAFINDPDVILLRDDVDLTDEQREMILDAASIFAGVMITSDNMMDWSEERRQRFQECLDVMKVSCK